MSKLFKKIVYGSLILGIFLLIYLVQGIIWPFLLSALLAYLLSPLVNYFELLGIRRILIVVVMYVFVLVVMAGALILVIPNVIHQAVSLNQKIPEYTEQIKGITLIWQWQIENKFPMIREKDLFNKASQGIRDFVSDVLNKIPSYLMNVFSIFAMLFIIPFATFFFIVDSKKAMESLYRSIPPHYVETVFSVISEIDESLGKYIRYQLIEAGFVGLLSFIGLLILGVHYSLLIGIVAGLGNLIPYFGPFVGMIVGLVVGFIQFKSFNILIQVFVLFILVQFIDNNFIQPIVLSKGTNLHPMVIFFSIMAGAQILGILGMFLAVPVVVMLKVTYSILLRTATVKNE
ncbi:MAG: AI-2E family transporter [Elusimicrobiota bacterium]